MEKMKFHKIRGVEKEICTAEQKIAYNFAFSDYDFAMRSDMELTDYLDSVVKRINRDHKDIAEKYDVDAIIHCLRQGFINYCKYAKEKGGVLGTYREIGKMFPSLYAVK